MAPKAAPKHFQVDGVECTMSKGLVNVGLNANAPWERTGRFPIKLVPTDVTEEQWKERVRQHPKFAAL